MRERAPGPVPPALPCRRGRFLPRRFGLASVLALPRHGDSGEDRWAAAGGAWALCDGASEGWDGAGWAAALARALVRFEDPREATREARRGYHTFGAVYTGQPNPNHGAGYAVQPNPHIPAPGGGAYAVQPHPPTPPPRDGAYAVQPNPQSTDYTVQPNPSPRIPDLASPTAASWLDEAAAARGSFSTALVVRVSRSGGFVRAYARGDTVLFIRDGLDTLAAFPLDDPGDFSLRPELVADRPAANGSVGGASAPVPDDFLSTIIPIGGLRRPVLCLATDALAARVLRAAGSERAELWDFLDRAGAAEVDAWARAETARGALREDDLTLLEVRP